MSKESEKMIAEWKTTNEQLNRLVVVVNQWRYGAVMRSEAVDFIMGVWREGCREIRKHALRRNGSVKANFLTYLECKSLLECGIMEALAEIGFGEL